MFVSTVRRAESTRAFPTRSRVRRSGLRNRSVYPTARGVHQPGQWLDVVASATDPTAADGLQLVLDAGSEPTHFAGVVPHRIVVPWT